MMAPSPIPAPARRTLLLLGGIVLIGAALRLWHLGAHAMWYDEAASLHLRHYADLRGSLFIEDNTNEPPMLAVLVRVWYELLDAAVGLHAAAPWSDFLLRLLPWLFGVFSIPLVFLAGRTILRSDAPALTAAALYAISPYQVYYAQELRIYTFTTIFALLAVYCMVRALEEDRFRHWTGMAGCFTVLLYSHFWSWTLVFICSVYFVLTLPAHPRLFWKWTAANAAAMALMMPALVLAWRMQRLVKDLEHPYYPHPTLKTCMLTFKDYFAGYGPTVWAYWPLFLLGAAFTALGVFAARRRWTTAVLLAVLTVAPLAVTGIYWGLSRFPLYEHRLFVYYGAFALIPVAAGIHLLLRPVLIGAALAAFAVFSAPLLADTWANRIHPIEQHRIAIWKKADFRSLAQHIEARWIDGDFVAYASHFSAYPLRHYLEHRPQARIGAGPEDAADFLRHFGNEPLLRGHGLMPIPYAEALADARRVWFVFSVPDVFGPTFEWMPKTHEMLYLLDQGWTRAGEQLFDGLHLILYERRF